MGRGLLKTGFKNDKVCIIAENCTCLQPLFQNVNLYMSSALIAIFQEAVLQKYQSCHKNSPSLPSHCSLAWVFFGLLLFFCLLRL